MPLGLALVLCGLGAAFLLPGLIIGMISARRSRCCTAPVSGLVTDIRSRSTSHGYSFYPVYEYFVDGVRYTKMGTYLSNHVPKVGSTVCVLYDPQNPKRSYIQGYDDKTLRILCTVFSIIGCIPLLICICIALFA